MRKRTRLVVAWQQEAQPQTLSHGTSTENKEVNRTFNIKEAKIQS